MLDDMPKNKSLVTAITSSLPGANRAIHPEKPFAKMDARVKAAYDDAREDYEP